MEPAARTLNILGAGPCGLYAGVRAQAMGARAVIVEKESHPGGLAAGFKRGDNWYDLGVHMLHAFDQEIFHTCSECMGEERIEVPLLAHIKWSGKLYHYPLRGRDIVAGIPPLTLARCLIGLLAAEVGSRWGRRVPGSDAESALIELYGSPLYEYFFESFTHRYWGIHPRDLSAEFIRQKMPRLSAVDVFKNLLEKLGLSRPSDSTEGALRFETLHYSRTGTETLGRSLADAITRQNGELHLDAPVVSVHHESDGAGRRVTNIETSTEVLGVADDVYLSTIPLPQLIAALKPSPPPDVLEASQQLRFKPMVVYALRVQKSRCMEALYTYYRDRVFHRVGEPKNAGLRVTPAEHTTLIVEMTCEVGDAKWSGEMLPQVLEDLSKEGLCEAEDVVEHHLLHATHAYPIFSKGFETELKKVMDYLGTFSNLVTTGRQGAFTYPNMHRAMRMGAEAAETLLAAKPDPS